MTFSFEKKLDPTNPADKLVRDIIFSDKITDHNLCQIRFTFPTQTSGKTKGRTETYAGIISPTGDGVAGATEVAILNFDFMVSGKPAITAEA